MNICTENFNSKLIPIFAAGFIEEKIQVKIRLIPVDGYSLLKDH